MAWTFSTLTTQDQYAPANRAPPGPTLEAIDAVFVTVHIYNAAVMFQKITARGGNRSGGWEPEMLLVPGVYSMRRRLSGIRFRSAVAGVPAIVSAEALSRGE